MQNGEAVNAIVINGTEAERDDCCLSKVLQKGFT